MMGKGNVLVVGSSGVGKTTLIKAVLGDDARVRKDAKHVFLKVFENDSSPFRIIDAGDLGGSPIARHMSIRAVNRWSKGNALDANHTNDINAIWFCVEGKSRKLIRQQIKGLSRATDVWRSAPIIVVITKSYAEVERADNVDIVRHACNRRRRLRRCVKAIIPVVATTYNLDETNYVAPAGLIELVDATNAALPEGIQAAAQNVASFESRRRRALARSVVGTAAAAGVAVGAVPIPFSDAMILTPIETGMIRALASLYDIDNGSTSKLMIGTILEKGTVSTAAKTAISALKGIPGLNLATSVINGAIAGSIVAALGEGTIRIFERISRGEKTLDDVEWAGKLLDSKLSKELVSQGTKLLGSVSDTGTHKEQRSLIASMLAKQA